MDKSLKIRLSFGVVSLLIASYLAFDLLSLLESQALWGHRVLWFWIFGWASFICFFGQFFSSLNQNNRLIFASSLSGILLGAGFMQDYTFFLMFIGFVPLLWVENVIASESKKASKWLVFKFAFNTFFIWNILSTWWIQNSSFVAGILGNTLNAVFMCIPFLFYHSTKKNMSHRAANLGFICYWMTFEIGHLTWDLSWPWLTLGNSFANLPALVQWYEFTGVFGGSLWILLVNIMLANGLFLYFKNNKIDSPLRVLFIKSLLCIILPLCLSLGLYFMHDIQTTKQAEVVSVQPNYEPHYQKFVVPQRQQYDKFIQLSDGQLTDKTAYLLFPETSFRRIEADKLQQSEPIVKLREYISGFKNLNVVFGLSAYLEYEEGDNIPDHLFTYCNDDKSFCQYIDYHNAAVQINNDNLNIPYYKKSKLVPGAESMPFIGGIDIFKNLILDLGGAPGLSLGTQKDRAVFSSKQGDIAPMICYESIFGDYVTGYTKNGAEAFFVITNDGWWDKTAGHLQHMYLSSLRAIENRRFVVRSANSGVSCFIDSRGDIYQQSEYNTADALRNDIFLHNEITFYCKYGDLIGRVSILITFWLLISMLSNGLRKEKL